MDLTVGLDVDEQSYDDGFGTARSRDNEAMFVNLRRAGESTTLSAAVRSDDNEDFGRIRLGAYRPHRDRPRASLLKPPTDRL